MWAKTQLSPLLGSRGFRTQVTLDHSVSHGGGHGIMLVSSHQNSCQKRNFPCMSSRMSPIPLTGPHPIPHPMGRESLT